jgi:hypothetical protein
VVAKARDLILPILGASQTDALIASVLDIASSPDLRMLRPLLHMP